MFVHLVSLHKYASSRKQNYEICKFLQYNNYKVVTELKYLHKILDFVDIFVKFRVLPVWLNVLNM